MLPFPINLMERCHCVASALKLCVEPAPEMHTFDTSHHAIQCVATDRFLPQVAVRYRALMLPRLSKSTIKILRGHKRRSMEVCIGPLTRHTSSTYYFVDMLWTCVGGAEMRSRNSRRPCSDHADGSAYRVAAMHSCFVLKTFRLSIVLYFSNHSQTGQRIQPAWKLLLQPVDKWLILRDAVL